MESRAPVLMRYADGVAALRQLPPGFRFRPTDEELVVQYLRRKTLGAPLPAAVIPVVPDLYGLDPWDIPGASEGEKYFFAVRPGAASGRCGTKATASGRWKPAGKDNPVVLPRPCGGGNLLVGVKRAMSFAPHRGKKKKKASSAAAATELTTGWVMHEYRLAAPPPQHKKGCVLAAEADGEWVVCRIFQRPVRRNRRAAAVPAGHGTAARRTTVRLLALASASSASCVTDGSDQEQEVSS